MSTFEKKLSISIGSALLFLVINLPKTYKFTSNILSLELYNEKCPTNMGLVIHTILFFVVTYLSMSKSYIKYGIKLKHTLYGSLLFYLIIRIDFN